MYFCNEKTDQIEKGFSFVRRPINSTGRAYFNGINYIQTMIL